MRVVLDAIVTICSAGIEVGGVDAMPYYAVVGELGALSIQLTLNRWPVVITCMRICNTCSHNLWLCTCMYTTRGCITQL